MSHLHERTDKTCLNCGTTVAGRYCQRCGQENVEPRESFWHLVVHFFNDFTHFDGKFFSTLKLLILKPGFLTSEYVAGRRVSYLNPIRMYLFISFLVFLVLFSIPPTKSTFDPANSSDSSTRAATRVRVTEVAWRPDSTGQQEEVATNRISISADEGFDSRRDTSVEAYMERQNALPEDKRDNPLRRYIFKKFILVNEYGRKHPETFADEIMSRFRHSLPQMFFISLPVFAFLLFLLYIRRREAYYYVSHGIFSIHFYCAAFVFFLFFSLIGWAAGRMNLFRGLAIIVCFFYLFLAMRKFYKQSWAKMILKYVILIVVMGFFLSILNIVFLFNSLLKVPPLH